MNSRGIIFEAALCKKLTMLGVDTEKLYFEHHRACLATSSAFDASGKCSMALLFAVSFATGINSVSFIQ